MKNIFALFCTLVYITDLVLFVPKYTRCKYDHTKRTKKLVWKGVCILLPLLILMVGTGIDIFETGFELSKLLLVFGMMFCAVGDIVLEIRFTRGGVLFFLGHVVYIASLILLQKEFKAITLIIYIMLASIGTFLTLTRLGKKHRFLLITYNATISASFALSIPLIISGRPANVLLGLGVSFLLISDWLLARNKAYGSNYGWSLVSLLFYFGGQILISTYPLLSIL